MDEYINSIKKITQINKEELLLLTINKSFLQQVKNGRNELKIPAEGFDNEKELDKSGLYKNEKNINKINKILNDLIKNNKINKSFKNNILLYLLYNNFGIAPQNHSINLGGDHLKVVIYNKPSKKEWNIIKKEVDTILNMLSEKKLKHTDLEYNKNKFNRRSKPQLKRNIKIIKDYDRLGEIIDETDEGLKERYSTKDIEAEEFDWGNVEQTKKNISKIKTSKHRYKGYINGVR